MGGKFRWFIAYIAKNLPFFLVVVLLFEFSEQLYAYANELYVTTNDGYYLLRTPFTWLVGEYIHYDLITIIVMLALSYGLKNCRVNKVAIYYLLFNFIQKLVIDHVFMMENIIFEYLVVNIIIILSIITFGALRMIRHIMKNRNERG